MPEGDTKLAVRLAIPSDSDLARLHYFDGKLLWAASNGRRAVAGVEAGYKMFSGYRRVTFGDYSYLTHRLIFLIHHGHMPEFVDHIDGNVENNKIENLREATKAQNCRNSKMQKNNSSGVKGVYPSKRGRWSAKIVVNRTPKYLGTFPNLEDAANAYATASKKYHGEFGRLQ